MKLTTLLLLACFLQVSAAVKGQATITLKLKKAEIAQVLSSIEQQGNYRFLYNNALTEIKRKVSVDVTNSGLDAVMNTLFAGTSLRYKLVENNLVVIMSQDIKITGKVTSKKDGTPIPGATVTIKGTSKGTVTSPDGSFTLNAPDNATLVVSFIGYTSQEIPVNNRQDIPVSLEESVSQMQQVVVVGYGVQRKVDITGSIAQVKGEEINKQPVTNAMSGLQGKVAGVQIVNDGKPGAPPTIRIRGTGTVYGSLSPLYVVDGVWYDDISFLNPGDIENMSILKDASSEAIYGMRAANGVVLITTKKGKSGRASINYTGYVGMQKATNKVKMANGNEYATIINELSAINNNSLRLDPNAYGAGTDWFKQEMRNAFTTNHQLSINGGSEKSSYNFSLSYMKQDGLIKTNDFSRITARLQNDFQVFEPLKIGYTVTAAAYNNHDIPDDYFLQLYQSAPIVAVFNPDGSYGDPDKLNLGTGAGKNPQASLDFYDQKTQRRVITGSAYADLRFAKHFVLHSSIGGEYGDSIIRNYTPQYFATTNQFNKVSKLTRTTASRQNWIVENTLTYDNKFENHSLKVLLGQAAQQRRYYKLIASADNVPNNNEGTRYLRLGNTDGRSVTDEGGLYNIASYFARVNYAYKDKYLLTASFRADGSSLFSAGDQWGYFPSVGVGWVMSEEPFIKNLGIFDNLKLRGSWGRVGNSSIPPSISVLRVSQDPFMTAIFGGVPQTGASINTLVPPSLVWEKSEGIDAGIEASVLNNRLYVEAGFFNRKTLSSIFDVPILLSLGTKDNNMLDNQATFRNQGWEFAANWKEETNSGFGYSIGGNFTIMNNKVSEVRTGSIPIYGGGSASTGGGLLTRTVVGEPIGQYYGYVVDGVFQNAAEVAASAQPNAKPGDFKYKDINGDKVIDAKDRVPIGNPNPKFTYGINTSFNYKNFDLAVEFQGVAGVDVYNANMALRFGNENFTKEFFDKRWHGEGTSNTYPSANIGGGQNYLPNTFFVESGSYFRIRNIQLGYTVPKAIANRWKMQNLRFFASAQNAFNFFKYRGFSPEIGGIPTAQGIDKAVYPLYATYNFGVNVTF
ncbi:TonB-dependent receptor [Chitinophaga qingshengii]|uniref:TonB-dependent receptor n=1 Tax=Chitinophaga qingshengii TaxID=1569794 RepID=A0ABR7TNR5_9BACT|nr:TonB-dependent receptor [Chitinophaga qingshengii]MBC9932116.1 TonB-dependent receptor [Chitinophaga qingshengii]